MRSRGFLTRHFPVGKFILQTSSFYYILFVVGLFSSNRILGNVTKRLLVRGSRIKTHFAALDKPKSGGFGALPAVHLRFTIVAALTSPSVLLRAKARPKPHQPQAQSAKGTAQKAKNKFICGRAGPGSWTTQISTVPRWLTVGSAPTSTSAPVPKTPFWDYFYGRVCVCVTHL